VNPYEIERLQQIARNNTTLRALNMPELGAGERHASKRARMDPKHEECDLDYQPTSDLKDEAEADDDEDELDELHAPECNVSPPLDLKKGECVY
jgi:hypothetical protein